MTPEAKQAVEKLYPNVNLPSKSHAEQVIQQAIDAATAKLEARIERLLLKIKRLMNNTPKKLREKK